MAATKPLILVADPESKIAVEFAKNLREKFGDDYEVVETTSEEKAVLTLNEAKSLNHPVAMVVACVDFENLIDTAASVDPMIRVVASSGKENRQEALDASLTDRVHEATLSGTDFKFTLGPTAEQLLNDWRTLCDPEQNGVIVVGKPYSARTHATSEFLSLWKVPHVVLDPDSRDGRQFAEGLQGTPGPLVVKRGEWTMLDPDHRKLALALGLTGAPRRPTYDVAIVGGGPGGLAAATMLAVEGASVMVIEGDVPGGQAARSSRIWNHPSHPKGVPGRDLMGLAMESALERRAELMSPYPVEEIRDAGSFKVLKLESGEVYARTVLLATGVEWRKLEATNADNLLGAGVYYGPSVDGLPDYGDQEVVIVGGANSAGQAAMEVAKTAAKVHLVIRGDSLEKSMSPYLINDIMATPNIELRTHCEVAAAVGSSRLTAVVLRNNQTGATTQINTGHMLVYIGAEPKTQWLSRLVVRSERGHILTGEFLEAAQSGAAAWASPRTQYATSRKNVWAIGDVREDATNRVVAASGDAATVAKGILEAIQDLQRREQRRAGAAPEIVKLKLGARDVEEATAQIAQSLFGNGYDLEPIAGKQPAWKLCQRLDSHGKKRDYIADVFLTSARRGGTTHFHMRLEIPQERLIGSPQQRRQQAQSWMAHIEHVVSQRAGIPIQQQRRAAPVEVAVIS
jgi:thioredoxin reductase (NADPH)